jgi:hypothetical protein
MPKIDDGSHQEKSGKHKEKKGFKSERRENYLRRMKGEKKPSKAKAPVVVKEVRFNAGDRKEYLLSLHKKKNERKVKAVVDARRKQQNENKKLRRERLEEARKAYNTYAHVPILPNYTYELPKYTQGVQAEAEEEREEVTEFGDGDVVVTVKSLIPTVASVDGGSSKKRSRMDFDDLPPSVAKKLESVHKANKGAPQTKGRVHMLKEMQRLHKIKQHSKKKSKSSKKRKKGKK